MKATIELIFAVSLIILSLILSSMVHGAETTLVVDLQKKIKSDFNKMEEVTKQQEAKAEKLNEDIKQIVTKLTNTADEDEKEGLRNRYLKKRAEHLQAEATKIVEIEGALGRIIENSVALDKVINKDNKAKLTPYDAEPVKDVLKGMANILTPIQALKADDQKLSAAMMTLRNLDMQYKTYFKQGRRTSIKEQMSYLEDLHAYIASVRSLLQYETAYLKSSVYFVTQDGIVKVINDFQKNFYSTTFKGFENQHQLDAEVLGDGNKVEAGSYKNDFDLKEIGNW